MLHLAFGLLLYFLPSIIGRDKRDAAGIFLLNLLLGWTVIGWIIALIWAVSVDHSSPAFLTGHRYCCQCGAIAGPGAHFCTACGHAV
jgi:hypothetical protein